MVIVRRLYYDGIMDVNMMFVVLVDGKERSF